MEVTQYNIGDIVVNKTDSAMSWRLIHNGDRIISLFEGSGVTHSQYTIFLSETEEGCEIEIYSLGLD